MLLFSWVFVSNEILIICQKGFIWWRLLIVILPPCSFLLFTGTHTRPSVKQKKCSIEVSFVISAQDHRAAAALPWHLWQPGEDEASSRGLVEASVCPQRGKTQNGKWKSKMIISYCALLPKLGHKCFRCMAPVQSWKAFQDRRSAAWYTFIILGHFSPLNCSVDDQ